MAPKKKKKDDPPPELGEGSKISALPLFVSRHSYPALVFFQQLEGNYIIFAVEGRASTSIDKLKTDNK